MTNTYKKKRDAVPYFVLHLPKGRAKAFFTVPAGIADVLIQYPIMCRGGSFDLHIEDVSNNDTDDNNSCHLTTEYISPAPEETAQAISERLAIRIGNPSGGSSAASSFLGIR
jgi:hypothetical protein